MKRATAYIRQDFSAFKWSFHFYIFRRQRISECRHITDPSIWHDRQQIMLHASDCSFVSVQGSGEQSDAQCFLCGDRDRVSNTTWSPQPVDSPALTNGVIMSNIAPTLYRKEEDRWGTKICINSVGDVQSSWSEGGRLRPRETLPLPSKTEFYVKRFSHTHLWSIGFSRGGSVRWYPGCVHLLILLLSLFHQPAGSPSV